MKKAERIAGLLVERIARGDYIGLPLPSERVLAQQVGVGYMTARQAVLGLIERGVLARADNGRLVVSPGLSAARRPAQIAFLAPAFPSGDVQRWRLALDAVLGAPRAAAKAFHYLHWDDPVIAEVLERSDGIFLYPDAEPIPAPVMARLAARRGVVVLDQDFTRHGIPSLRLAPPGAIFRVLDHLAARGHRRVACLHVQPDQDSCADRLDQWRRWKELRGMDGAFLTHPVRPGQATIDLAYRVLRDAPLTDTAVFATTFAAAVGALRALHDRGLRPGRDVAVCTLNDEEQGAYTIPSLTALAPADPAPFLRACVAWMSDAAAPWTSAMLMEPAEVLVAERESTAG